MHIRPATPADISLIYQFIQHKAEFDRSVGAYQGTPQTSEAKIQATLFGPHPFAHVLFAEQQNQSIGFALYGFRYSSFAGQPSIWLDDLYIDANYRSQGAGAALMQQLANIASSQNCTHIAWTADARNQRGLQFYHRLGAGIIQQEGQRCYWQWQPKPPSH
ncbi:GNAT family N-acetyltransferase [Acaryochloris marina]|uniref:Acetyltransferase, putative n=1 Tax=Acaryochloris marina (strain MBIC 11017) TaxID=329726 RepID=B0CDR3_ACAM1|nr:GNAT family N-acetyltransferase [Acaryochloris marina]ABW29265.1 acetyltransferase, putative [Acaryochloris marina MBIC11017]BDM78182.1 GCN5 family N-acetyltransferase [Acaryochloris marina MBIC10699]